MSNSGQKSSKVGTGAKWSVELDTTEVRTHAWLGGIAEGEKMSIFKRWFGEKKNACGDYKNHCPHWSTEYVARNETCRIKDKLMHAGKCCRCEHVEYLEIQGW
jgi:hypothetical protein